MTLKDFITIIVASFVVLMCVLISASAYRKQNTTQIDSLLVENLLLKHKIEILEYKLQQNNCK